MPSYDFLYLGDSGYAPYGERPEDWIRERSFACIEWLFDQGCGLVIVACNTATAVSIRPRQTTFPHRKALSVTLPGVEAVVELGLRRVGVLATQVTVHTGLYQQAFDRM
ncbi:MAG: aspartate/glutamate racemase family protein [Candidatus Peribacteria bacterium]|nr:MAG: aspartate/glutamate racemase family protein [Candidatus Peribacteria bacterium]